MDQGLESIKNLTANVRLRRWSEQIGDWAKHLTAIYIYFDNNEAGYAAQNARTLKRMVIGEDTSVEDVNAA
jgi:uncharacterized protein YecE (DUF72 family)